MQIFRNFHPYYFFSSSNPLSNKFMVGTCSICWSCDPKCSSNIACTYFRVLFLACDGRRRGDSNGLVLFLACDGRRRGDPNDLLPGRMERTTTLCLFYCSTNDMVSLLSDKSLCAYSIYILIDVRTLPSPTFISFDISGRRLSQIAIICSANGGILSAVARSPTSPAYANVMPTILFQVSRWANVYGHHLLILIV